MRPGLLENRMGFIKFTEDRATVEAVPQVFKAGRVYDLPEPSCERWKKRAAAIEATEAEFKAQAAGDAKAKKPAKEATQAAGDAKAE
jgi:hypothetical protein